MIPIPFRFKSLRYEIGFILFLITSVLGYISFHEVWGSGWSQLARIYPEDKKINYFTSDIPITIYSNLTGIVRYRLANFYIDSKGLHIKLNNKEIGSIFIKPILIPWNSITDCKESDLGYIMRVKNFDHEILFQTNVYDMCNKIE